MKCLHMSNFPITYKNPWTTLMTNNDNLENDLGNKNENKNEKVDGDTITTKNNDVNVIFVNENQ